MAARIMEDVWRRFKGSGDSRARDAIINNYGYLVKITAGRVVSNLPPNLEREDLYTAGSMGLIKAVDQFDPGRQVKFETYAIALIRGAILESLREEDWVPRSIRERAKALERAFNELEISLGRPPKEDDIAQHMGVSSEELSKMMADTGRGSVLSLDDLIMGSDGSERLHLSDVVPDDGATPVADVELRERIRHLGGGIDRLPERERLVIALYYYEGLTFKEIGKVLSVSESRVYQLHTQAVLRMRGYLNRDQELFRT
ncbi:FliA/WhiG family RNA polymerase sigma factor [Armatimonas sp.]|uniref:FliA/WhiG family RNA polymerase sigma factor n=1 Tax=Armatimonas sp. TaxID=1872638 RepID=UPI00286BE0D7|nr:FliA/WhiG family RNA polymerase sigma factor [Armatimonas sp.]